MIVFPDFYCCYLLRSVPKSGSLYIGSTPEPVRRLRQHNGEISAGAYRTKKKGSRPWVMVMFVYGFPSKISALQFEHAWQHPYQTRHITSRITCNKTSGRSLHHKLGNARLLLSSGYFSGMNLKVQIFDQEVYKAWCTNKFGVSIPDTILVDTHFHQDERLYKGGNYDQVGEFKSKSMKSLEAYVDRSIDRAADAKVCDICEKGLDAGDLLGFCFHDCHLVSHLACLRVAYQGEGLVPLKGECPECKRVNFWSTTVQCALKVRENVSG